MITGIVTADRDMLVELTVSGPRGRKQRVDAVIDTGFSDWLSLPPAIINFLRLPFQRTGRGLLADGSEFIFDIYEAVVAWDRRRRRIAVYEADAMPLVGMALLEGYELRAQIRAGGKVTVKPLPRRRRA
jgi:clan AA aspartic protease